MEIKIKSSETLDVKIEIDMSESEWSSLFKVLEKNNLCEIMPNDDSLINLGQEIFLHLEKKTLREEDLHCQMFDDPSMQFGWEPRD